MSWMSNTLARYRVIAYIEGISYLLLWGIAMPLKYGLGMPIAVRITGSLHGLLFVLFGLSLMQVWIEYKWSFKRVFVMFFASLLPFATIYAEYRSFLGERSLKDEQAEVDAAQPAN